jgi:hypothetical protein
VSGLWARGEELTVSVDTEELSDAVAQSLFSARHWYSGQHSALYSWASSGTPVVGLAAEATAAAEHAERLAERLALGSEDLEELDDVLTDCEALAALAVWAERRGL